MPAISRSPRHWDVRSRIARSARKSPFACPTACAGSGSWICLRYMTRRIPEMTFPEGGGKQLHVVGDRVLISPDEGEDRTRVGLYLPATALDSQQVQGGTIVATGPGDPVPDCTAFDAEPGKA